MRPRNKIFLIVVLWFLVAGIAVYWFAVSLQNQGQAPSASLDEDGNGVYDRVDSYIESKYSGTDNLLLRSGLRQYASALQNGIEHSDDKELSIQFAEASDRAQECVYYLSPDSADEALSGLEAALLNSHELSQKFVKLSEQSAGEVFESAKLDARKDSCAFKID